MSGPELVIFLLRVFRVYVFFLLWLLRCGGQQVSEVGARPQHAQPLPVLLLLWVLFCCRCGAICFAAGVGVRFLTLLRLPGASFSCCGCLRGASC